MTQRHTVGRWACLVGSFALLTAAQPTSAQAPADVRAAFLKWASSSLYRIGNGDLPASTEDLRPIEKMIGDAKIVGVSEGVHGGAEPLIFRNRLFKHLVEHLGFRAITLESGIVESRMLNDYVTQGKGEFDTVLRQGFSRGFDTFRQNGELIRWMRDYNARLPPSAVKLQVYGLDVSGSPGSFDAERRPDTALRSALEFLQTVDAPAASALQSRVEKFLPVLHSIDGYGALPESERDTLTAAIADLVSLLERQRLVYLTKSTPEDFDWGERAAIGARQTDTWFRRMPIGWKPADGFDWLRYGHQVRDRSMADNLDWVRRRLGPRARTLVFAAVAHLATMAVKDPETTYRESIPMGAYLKERFGSDYVNILNLVMNGEIQYCSATPRRLMPLQPPPAAGVETLFAAVNMPRYLLDLRRAPPGVSAWLQQVHDHWNGFNSFQFATSSSFDLVYFVSPVSAACKPLGG